jgi:hypothetical protein
MSAIEWSVWKEPVPGFKTKALPITDGICGSGRSQAGTFLVSCVSGMPEGEFRDGPFYAVAIHRNDGSMEVLGERLTWNPAYQLCRDELREMLQDA